MTFGLLEPFRIAGRRAVAQLSALSPARRHRERQINAFRNAGLAWLDAFTRVDSRPAAFERILVDGQWDNGNFWLRYALLRRALGLTASREIGILGQYNRARVATAFAAFGFEGQFDYGRHIAERGNFLEGARALLSATRDAAEIHDWKLPNDFPPVVLYDAILKRQRRANVDLSDPALASIVAEALAALSLAEEIISLEKPNLVVMSHAVDFTYGALAWVALSRDIPVIALYGDYGTNRFMHLQRPDDLFAYPSRSAREDEDALSPQARIALADVGRRTLDARIGGQTADVSAIYAYRRRRASVDRDVLAERFGWDPARPVIGVYAPNWFDYPNGSGRLPFRDFREWADVTLEAARAAPHVNWLFKTHPCDEWYGTIHGERFADLVAEINAPHVRLCDTAWNGRALLDTMDGLVTVHGTAGLEMASLGKPVLVPYAGWYGTSGCVVVSSSKDDYVGRLAERWWDGQDKAAVAAQASLFAGWYLAVPAWHDGWFLHDDAHQDAIWWDLDRVFNEFSAPIAREVAEIAAWVADKHRYFQIFKLRRAEAFAEASPRAFAEASADEDPRMRQFAAQPTA